MKEKIKITDGAKWCHCAKHDGFSLCDDFHKDKTSKHGYRSSCIECERLHKLNKTQPLNYNERYARILLSRIGYDVKSKVPIWQQFLLKHDL